MGIDEVGRGPWAGAGGIRGCYLARHDSWPQGLKLLTAKRRQQLADEILAYSYVGVGWSAGRRNRSAGLNSGGGPGDAPCGGN